MTKLENVGKMLRPARAALLAAPLLFGAADAKAQNKPCEQDFMCSAARGLIEPISSMAPKTDKKDLNRALVYVSGACRADLIKVLLAAGADKNFFDEHIGSPMEAAEFNECGSATKNLLR